MKIKTAELTGQALDWAVAKALGYTIEVRPAGACGRPLYVLAAEPGHTPWVWEPSSSWNYGGPIGEREHLQACYQTGGTHKGEWGCIKWNEGHRGFVQQYGATELIAKMRCYVASKLGDEVELPKELPIQRMVEVPVTTGTEKEEALFAVVKAAAARNKTPLT